MLSGLGQMRRHPMERARPWGEPGAPARSRMVRGASTVTT
jgi:hypothetical protein